MNLHEDIAVTAEICGTTMSEAAAELFATELAGYDRQQVTGALRRCRRELKGRLTMAEVLTRLEDGRPGPEEAWAMLPKTEADTAVWTTEMSQAFGVVVAMIDAGELVPARMAFKETYARLVSQARDQRKPAEWHVTLGHDKAGREAKIIEAVIAGRLSQERAQQFVPLTMAPTVVARIAT